CAGRYEVGGAKIFGVDAGGNCLRAAPLAAPRSDVYGVSYVTRGRPGNSSSDHRAGVSRLYEVSDSDYSVTACSTQSEFSRWAQPTSGSRRTAATLLRPP